MAIYTLNIAKWRCGKFGPFSWGEGSTQMLNEQGFSCCVGQFAIPKAPVGKLLHRTTPADAANFGAGAYDEVFVKGVHHYSNTSLANNLMTINDNIETSVKEKIQLVRDELKKAGHQLRVINQHLIPK